MDWVVGVLKQFGLVEGLFAVFFIGVHIVIYKQRLRFVRVLEAVNKRLSADNERLLKRDDYNMTRFDELYSKVNAMEKR